MANFLLLLGPLLLISGLLNYFLTPFFAKLISSRILIIQKGTIYYDKWIKAPVPFHVNLYVFDIKNPKEIMKGKPEVEEIGPFQFTQTREKKILDYSPDMDTVRYMETKDFKFNREGSIADLNQHYITPNLAFLSTIMVYNSYLKNFPLSFVVQPVAERLLSTVMEYYQQNLFINVTVDQIMFKGVHLSFVPLLQLLSKTFESFGIESEITALSNNSFSYFRFINHTSSGPYEVYTGIHDISKLSQLKRFKDKDILNLWSDEECNVVKGSDGIQFSPLKKDKSKLYVFTQELCRAVTLEYKRDSNVRGIKTYLYEPTIDMFMGDPKTGKCHCTNSYKCKNPGVLDLSPCWYKSPLYASLPHFMGDEFKEIRNSIIGLKPDKSKHRSYLHLDPITGSSLKGSKRGQMNTYIERISSVRSIRTVRSDLYLPLFWYEENGEINDELEAEIKQKSVYPLLIASYMTLFSFILGTILSFFSCIACTFCTKKHKKKVQQSNSTNEVYLDKSYEKLTNLDDALSTKTDSTNDSSSSSTTSKQTSNVSIISNNSGNSFKQPGFILVQPMQYDNTPLTMLDNSNNNTHSLALIPAYQQNLPNIVNDINYHQMNMPSILNTQFENKNLPIVDYRPPSPKTLDQSMRIISKLIELNSKNLINDQLNLQNENQSNNQHQQDRSINEMQINQSKLRKIKKLSSQEDSSFDFD